jgi:iron transport multicopper oxidase
VSTRRVSLSRPRGGVTRLEKRALGLGSSHLAMSRFFDPAALFITFREAVEAGVIVSVCLSFLAKAGLEHLRPQGALSRDCNGCLVAAPRGPARPLASRRQPLKLDSALHGLRGGLVCWAPLVALLSERPGGTIRLSPALASPPVRRIRDLHSLSGGALAAPWRRGRVAASLSRRAHVCQAIVPSRLFERPSWTDARRAVFWGVGCGLAASVALGIAVLTAFYHAKQTFFAGPHKGSFEGSVMLVASVMVTLVAFAMLRMLRMHSKWQARLAEAAGEGKLEAGRRYAFFLVTFSAVLREGVEAVVFITGVSQANPTAIPLPGFLGICLGCCFSYVVFFGSKPVDIRVFMYVTAFCMFAIGAGLLSRGLHAFQMMGSFGSYWADPLVDPMLASEYAAPVLVLPPSWVNVPLGDFRKCCRADGTSTTFFALLRAITGYSDRPTRLEIISYCSYWAYIIASLLFKARANTLHGKPVEPAAITSLSEDVARDVHPDELVIFEKDEACTCEHGACACTAPGGRNAFVVVEPHAIDAAALAPQLLRQRFPLRMALALGMATAVALLIGLPVGLIPRDVVRPVVFYTLVIGRNASLGGPSGKAQMTVNGQWPGPTLRVPFGSKMSVTIINALDGGEATAVHWHGMFMRGTPFNDGVVGVTQCPIPSMPGANSFVVEFEPDRPGTFWYHGHMNGQYPDGLYGAFIVEDGGAALAAAGAPATRAEEWVLLAADWYNTPVCWPSCMDSALVGANATLLSWFMSPESGGLEPIPDAIVVNSAFSGAMTLAADRSQRQLARFINVAALSLYNISIDGLPLTVVELDGQAVEPMDVPWLVLNVAQRAVVVLDWARLHPDVAFSPALTLRISAISMYLMDPNSPPSGPANSTSSTLAGAPTPFATDWTGIIAFTPGARPSYGAPPVLSVPPPFETFNLLAAVPVPALKAPEATVRMEVAFGFASDSMGVNRGYVNNVSYAPAPQALSMPVLYSALASQPLQVARNLSGVIIGDGMRPFVLPQNRVVEMLIINLDNGQHPFHVRSPHASLMLVFLAPHAPPQLHGHNFWLLATSHAQDERADGNYVRRDVVSIPPSGWAKLRFITDNPGAWVLHCHICLLYTSPSPRD